jgi:hypothetical protein
MKPPPGVISVADHTGWAHLVCVSVQGGVPVLVERRRVSLIEPGLPTQPYEHDTVAMREDDAEVLVARVRRSIAACTTRAMERVVSELAPTCAVVALAIRKPPFPRIPSSVRAVHASYQLKCSADGMLYQEALCRAAKRQKLEVRLCRRGEEVELAASSLGVSPDEVEAFVTRAGRPAGPPWTQEHRLAYAAAIAALAPHTRLRLASRGID